MVNRVDADPAALDGLRQSLLSFNSRQVAALDAVLAEATRTALELEAARERWEGEVYRRLAALRDCEAAAAAAAAADGGHVDCSHEARRVAEAQEHLSEVLRWVNEVATATEIYKSSDIRHREYLSSSISDMRTGLEARIMSLEAYLRWRVQVSGSATSPANATRAIAVDRSAKLRYESLNPPRRAEEVEGPAGNPERRG